MNTSRRNQKCSILSLILSLIMIIGSAAVPTSAAQALPENTTHWIKQSKDVTEAWHPLIDELQALGLLDTPMTRSAFEILIQESFDGLEAYRIPTGSEPERAQAAFLYVTRMEGAFYLHHLLKAENILEQQLYTDQPEIPDWALKSVLGMTQKGIFKGFPDGSFKSHNWLTHAEAICLVAKSQQHWMKDGVTAKVPSPDSSSEEKPQPAPQPEPEPGPEPGPEPQPEPEPAPEPAPTPEPNPEENLDYTTEDAIDVTIPDPQPDPEPQPEPQPEPEPQPGPLPTHTAEIELILPERVYIVAGDALELYLIDPDLNTDPEVVETVEMLLCSFDYYETIITLTEISPNSEKFLAWIKPVFEPGEDPFEFRVWEEQMSSAELYYYDPVDVTGKTNVLRSISFDILPYE